MAFIKQSIAITIIALLVSSASASIITVNQTLDLTQPQSTPGPGFQGWQNQPAFNGGYTAVISEGDTFDFTIDFLGSQALTANNLSFVWAFSYAADSNLVQTTGTGTFSFLDANGSALLTSNPTTTTEGDVHFGQQFNSANFTSGIPSSFTFWGVRYTGTVDDYDLPNLFTRDYTEPAFYFNADSISITPEPSSLLVWGSLVVVGLTCNRRRLAR